MAYLRDEVFTQVFIPFPKLPRGALFSFPTIKALLMSALDAMDLPSKGMKIGMRTTKSNKVVGVEVGGSKAEVLDIKPQIQAIIDDVAQGFVTTSVDVGEQSIKEFIDRNRREVVKLANDHEIIVSFGGKCTTRASSSPPLPPPSSSSSVECLARATVTSAHDGRVVEVSCVTCDVMDTTGEVLVNAANGGLRHMGGIAKAIADAAGPSMNRECKVAMRRYSTGGRDLTVGTVIHTTSGHLISRGIKPVLHVVSMDGQRTLLPIL